jgi:spermidine synthase
VNTGAESRETIDGKSSEKNMETTSYRASLNVLVYTCFFLSGFTGLVYEVLWTRMIERIIGTSPLAVAIIISVFMAGLGAGSFLGGKWADRLTHSSSSLSAYALLETAIGLYALCIPFFVTVCNPLFSFFYTSFYTTPGLYSLLLSGGSLLLFIAPALCMGATLPFLVKFTLSSIETIGRKTGILYGINTLGGAFGSLTAGFWLIHHLGLHNSMLMAVAVNILIGVVCFIAYRQLSTHPDTIPRFTRLSRATKEQKRSSSSLSRAVLFLFMVSGFSALAYEVLWTRLLSVIIAPTTYSFTVVLFTYIVGLGLGSIVFGWIADRVRRPFVILFYTQAGAALLFVLVSQILGNSQLFFAKVIYRFADHFALLELVKTALLFGFMIVSTIVQGAAFPLVIKIYTTSSQRAGRAIGKTYLYNAIGSVGGSFTAGFILIPLLGKQTSISAVAALQTCTAAAVMYIYPVGT